LHAAYKVKERYEFSCFRVPRNRKQFPTGGEVRKIRSGNYVERRGKWLLNKESCLRGNETAELKTLLWSVKETVDEQQELYGNWKLLN